MRAHAHTHKHVNAHKRTYTRIHKRTFETYAMYRPTRKYHEWTCAQNAHSVASTIQNVHLCHGRGMGKDSCIGGCGGVVNNFNVKNINKRKMVLQLHFEGPDKQSIVIVIVA